jgi:superfamily II DNA or RNA helicase/SAM-dependent methyltransferase
MNEAISYYNVNALRFYSETVDVDMSELYGRFLTAIPNGGLILDAGCGSGRDSRAFLDRGYRVLAFDGSVELARLASEKLGQSVNVCKFETFSCVEKVDGIWACASLLHVKESELPNTLSKLWSVLKPGGIFYLSFKLGDGERLHGERYFTDATESRLHAWFVGVKDVDGIDCWTSKDKRPDRDEYWLNALVWRQSIASPKLITGSQSHPFLPHLYSALAQADEIDFAVAFIKTTGLRLLLQDLQVALGQGEEHTRSAARVRILTSDYLDVTDPDALRLLMLLKENGAEVRIFETAGASFHLKAYLFAHVSADGQLKGTGFIGSSNISRMALTDGLEWNYRIDYPGDSGFLDARASFESLFKDSNTIDLTDAWIDHYESRRIPLSRAISPGSDEQDPPPVPTPVQLNALAALAATRQEGYRRGLVVLATGLGKTWLSAFDAEQIGARRVLFIAHREEILHQAAETFLRIRPHARVGFYMGQVRDTQVDVLCASVQTLGKAAHLKRFSPQHFDYIVVDEFHHAAAPTYRLLLNYFAPQFLLGLTATPDRTDQSDILTLCDDNLVFGCDLFEGITAGLLAPFHYFGIWDESVDYAEIPWRSGRFDPEQLTNKLATLERARHVLKQWQSRAQSRTIAFCVSVKHAEFMAAQFQLAGIKTSAVYAGSSLGRSEALKQLERGSLQVIFTVDLFNEGVDLPSIDTVLMLRPTESNILFLQQLGRGIRKAPGKQRLVVLDFIGNHHSFLNKPMALAKVGSTYRQLAEFARKVEFRQLELPPGCFINYDLQLIDFLKSLDSEGTSNEYLALKDGLGRRPSLTEFYRAGANVSRMRQEYGNWFGLVAAMGDLGQDESHIVETHGVFFREIEVTQMNKSFKMVLLEAMQELGGWITSPSLDALVECSWQVLQRRRPLLADLPENLGAFSNGEGDVWRRYWRENPINAWLGGNQTGRSPILFELRDNKFTPTFDVLADQIEQFTALVQELIDFRLTSYEVRRMKGIVPTTGVSLTRMHQGRTELPTFTDLAAACNYFKTGSADGVEYSSLDSGYGPLDPVRQCIIRVSDNSMDGGSHPIHEGDHLLLERTNTSSNEFIEEAVIVVEHFNVETGRQYLLRRVTKAIDGRCVLMANNKDYVDLKLNDQIRNIAKLQAVIDSFDLIVGKSFMREDIPKLFGESFNPGNWNAGHIILKEQKAHILLVTINKQGKAENHRYLDRWINDTEFHWQSQNSTTPTSMRGRELIDHKKLGIAVHLFVRQTKLQAGKGAPFIYEGRLRYLSHTGSAPMNVTFELTGDKVM